jgi:long-subunit fatty acid transport protein
MHAWRVGLGAVAALAVGTRAEGGVLYSVDLGAAALGQAGAFIAAPDDATAAWYNPAGLAAQRGLRLALEGGGSRSQLEFDQDAAGGAIHTDGDGLLPVVLAGASYDFGRKDLTAGLFAYVPSSSSFMYDPKGQQRFQGVGGHYKLAFFHAAVAYRIADQLSLGVALGPTYFHATQYNGVSIAQAGQDPYDPFYAVTVTTDVQSKLFFSANLGIS